MMTSRIVQKEEIIQRIMLPKKKKMIPKKLANKLSTMMRTNKKSKEEITKMIMENTILRM